MNVNLLVKILLRKKVVMKILDLPVEQIKWLISEFNEIERKAFEKGYSEATKLLNEGKIIQNLLREEYL